MFWYYSADPTSSHPRSPAIQTRGKNYPSAPPLPSPVPNKTEAEGMGNRFSNIAQLQSQIM